MGWLVAGQKRLTSSSVFNPSNPLSTYLEAGLGLETIWIFCQIIVAPVESLEETSKLEEDGGVARVIGDGDGEQVVDGDEAGRPPVGLIHFAPVNMKFVLYYFDLFFYD